MRVAVTGGCGFIGSHVVDQLVQAGHEVRVIDVGRGWRNPAADYLAGDLFDEAALGRGGGRLRRGVPPGRGGRRQRGGGRPGGAVRLNVEGTARVLEAARRPGCGRVLLASTVWVYGATSGPGRADRGRPGRPAPGRATCTWPPSWAPNCSCTATGRCTASTSPSCGTASRTGRGCGDELVVARFVRAALDGTADHHRGTGEQQRNYVYVEDLADAHVRALSPAAADQTLALEGGTPVSVREIADTVRSWSRRAGEYMPARTADYQGVSISSAAGQGTARLGPGHPVRRGCPPLPGLAAAGRRPSSRARAAQAP